jgi:hypothetical protein
VEVLLTCATCEKWFLRRETHYAGNGEVIINWSDPEGKGKCTVLNILTAPEFGCNQYEQGEPIVEVAHKPGEPWHHWVLGPCPTCKGNGVAAGVGIDRDCCGTGLVQYYDDGYIGENRTKMHPKEKVHGKRGDLPVPVCFNCVKPIDPVWKLCPFCGTQLQAREKNMESEVHPL